LHFEVSLIVKAQREKVYSAYTDFEAWPKWSKQTAKARVLGREGATVSVESEAASSGRPRISIAKLTLTPPQSVETESSTRLTKTKKTVRFEEVPEGTKVTAALDVQVKGRWAWVFAPREWDEAKSSASEALKSFAEYVEGLDGDL